jgi:hypothetical protein
VAPQRVVELAAGADVELGEHLAQVPLHGTGADEQLRADLGVGPPLARQPGDLPLLGGQLRARVLVPRAHLLPGGQELAPGAFGEGLDAQRGQRVEREPQLNAGVDPAVLPAQPFAVAQPGPRRVGRHPGLVQQLDRLAVRLVGAGPGGHQRPGPGRRPAGPAGPARLGDPGQPVRRGGGRLALVAARRRLGQLVQRPRRHDELLGGAGPLRRVGGQLVLAEAVVEHRRRVVRVGQRRALAPVRGAARQGPGQLVRGRRVPAPRGEQERDVGQGGRPDPRVDPLALGHQGRRLGQLAGLDVQLGQVVQRERQPAEGAAGPGQPDLAVRELEPRLVVPQIHRDQVVRGAQPVQLHRLRAVAGQRLLEQGGGGLVAVGQAGGQAAQQQLDVRQRMGLHRTAGRQPGGPGHLRQVRPADEPAGVDPGHQGLDVGPPRQFGVQVLQPLRGPQQQRRGVAAPAQRERDLGPHPLDAGLAQFGQRPDLGRDQEGLRGQEIPRRVLGVGRGERPRGAVGGVRGERHGALQERGAGGDPAPAQGPARGADQLAGHGLVGPGRGVRAMPGPAVRVGQRIGRRGQRRMGRSPVRRRGGPVDGRAHQRMPEAYVRADVKQAGLRRHLEHADVQAEPLRRPQDQRHVAHRVGGHQQDHLPGVGGQHAEALEVLILDAPGQVARVRPIARIGQGEPAGQLAHPQAPAELDQGQRVPAGLLDDPGPHPLVERARAGPGQQRPGRRRAQPAQPQLGQSG